MRRGRRESHDGRFFRPASRRRLVALRARSMRAQGCERGSGSARAGPTVGGGGGSSAGAGQLRLRALWGAVEDAILVVLCRGLRTAGLGAEPVLVACPVGGWREGERPVSWDAACNQGRGGPALSLF